VPRWNVAVGEKMGRWSGGGIRKFGRSYSTSTGVARKGARRRVEKKSGLGLFPHGSTGPFKGFKKHFVGLETVRGEGPSVGVGLW